jgi:glycosyltransferase involved in cell wall biosynthesis
MKDKIKKVLLITHAIAPYRIPLFNYIHQMGDFDFKVITLAERERNRNWRINQNEIKFNHKVLPGLHLFIYGEKREIPIHLNRKVLVTIWQYNPDVVITAGYDSLAYWQAFLYCKIFKKKYILWNETTLLSVGSIKGVRGFLKRMFVRRADKYIICGIKAKEYLEYFGAKLKDIYISINTVDVDCFRDKVLKYRNGINFTNERKLYPKYLLLYIGRFTKGKGIIQVLTAIKNLKDKEISLILVGSGPEEKTLKDYCSKNKIQNIIFEGFRQKDELPKYYALADIFIFPSFYDVWGMVVNEALASGLYALSSQYAGASYDLIKEGWNGKKFNPNNIEEIVNLIKQTKEQIDNIRKRRETISQYTCRDFGIKGSAEAFLKAIENV